MDDRAREIAESAGLRFSRDIETLSDAISAYGDEREREALEWRPIESAPKDDTRIVVAGRIFQHYEVDKSKLWSEREYSCVTAYSEDRLHLLSDEWHFGAPGITTAIRARVWMPLPQPPRSLIKESK